MRQSLRHEFLRGFDGVVSRTIFIPWISEVGPTDAEIQACWSTLNLCGCPVVVLNSHTLEKWIHPEFPVPQVFFKLTPHQATSYLQCYVMHVYGGAIGSPSVYDRSWDMWFDELEFGVSSALIFDGGRDFSPRLICRRNTFFTKKWFSAVGESLGGDHFETREMDSVRSENFAAVIFNQTVAEFSSHIIKKV
jgi:hypothetical protein